MEDECHHLDQQITKDATAAAHTSDSFHQYLDIKSQIKSLEEEKEHIGNELQQAQQILVILLFSLPDPQNDARVVATSTLIKTNTDKITIIVSDTL